MSEKVIGLYKKDINFLLKEAKVKQLIQVYSFRVNSGSDYIDAKENKEILECLKRLSNLRGVPVVSVEWLKNWCKEKIQAIPSKKGITSDYFMFGRDTIMKDLITDAKKEAEEK